MADHAYKRCLRPPGKHFRQGAPLLLEIGKAYFYQFMIGQFSLHVQDNLLGNALLSDRRDRRQVVRLSLQRRALIPGEPLNGFHDHSLHKTEALVIANYYYFLAIIIVFTFFSPHFRRNWPLFLVVPSRKRHYHMA